MPSKKRITRVRFNDASRTANQKTSNKNTTRPASQRSNLPSITRNAIQRSILPSNTRTANQRSNSPSNTHTASPLQITTPTSLAPSSNVSTPRTLPTFDYIMSRIFNKSLIASLTSKNAVLKEVRDCILTNNESRLKVLNPYIHSYWKDLHVRSGWVCIDEKIAIPNVLREALNDDIHSRHPGIWGMICMATHCWWSNMHRKFIVKATECKPCTVIDKNLKSFIPAK